MNVNYNNEKLERFIPITFNELKENILELDIAKAEEIEEFASLLQGHYHNLFHSQLIDIKESYHPFNPDRDTVTNKKYSHNDLENLQTKFLKDISPLLNSANYEELSEDDLNEAMNETSPYGVDVSVDFEDFEIIKLFFRGSAIKKEIVRTPKSLYLKKAEQTTYIYRRLFILFKQKQHNADEKELIYLKLFKDIPRNDLEMLFPNTKVKISLVDKVKLLVTGGGGTIGGAVTLLGKLAVTLDPIALLTAIGVFAGIIWRQIKSIFNHRVKYMAKLAESLYYYNLDNNAGVISYILDMAEAEEGKEAFLAYMFLLRSPKALSIKELDFMIEEFIFEKFSLKADFEIDDAIVKLTKLQLIDKTDNKLVARDIKSVINSMK